MNDLGSWDKNPELKGNQLGLIVKTLDFALALLWMNLSGGGQLFKENVRFEDSSSYFGIWSLGWIFCASCWDHLVLPEGFV